MRNGGQPDLRDFPIPSRLINHAGRAVAHSVRLAPMGNSGTAFFAKFGFRASDQRVDFHSGNPIFRSIAENRGSPRRFLKAGKNFNKVRDGPSRAS